MGLSKKLNNNKWFFRKVRELDSVDGHDSPLNRGSTPFPLESFVRYLRIYQSIDTTKFRA